ncbi:gliding motility lipoprotein GldH [Kordia sp. SMS9]|uniref:gliding motility lipoprotein GldH n=1 Tax=Kordia sp. SMS9 TaxID=2282170 RepID=UPI000E109DE7|nr:gliding motility lipoprotein GldH [Kordia sp. SMS9]AXG69073.1 gliding motility lipoprotein GldH [Kordia sp. SMS9]
MQSLTKSAFFIAILSILLISCDGNRVYDQYVSTGNSWDKDTPLTFKFQQPDTIHKYNLFINVRNTNEYEFRNLFLIVNMNFPNGNVVKDTLAYEMAKPNGEWLGTGMTTKESKLSYKPNVRFPFEGTYEVSIQQAMRKINEPQGIQSLQGITEVGFRIEKK